MNRLLLVLILWHLSIFTAFTQTTLEEYNYITKGYKIQQESGLDMKKGYILSDMTDFTSLDFGQDENQGKRGMVFKGLIRNSESKPCAIMAIYQRKVNGVIKFEEHFCIPMPNNNDLWNKTLEQINANWSSENAKLMFSSMLWAMMKFASQEAAK